MADWRLKTHTGIAQIAENLLWLIQRDIVRVDTAIRAADALIDNSDRVYTDAAALPEIAIWGLDRRLDVIYPACFVIPGRYQGKEGDDLREFAHTCFVELSAAHKDADEAVRLALRYARAVDSVLLSAQRADIARGFVLGAHTPVRWEVTEGAFFPMRQVSDRRYLKIVQLLVKVELSEVMDNG